MEIRKILYATDFSEGSAVALPHALDIAKRYGARLYFVHVMVDVVKTSSWYVPHASLDDVYSDMEKSAQAELEKIFIDEMRGFKNIEHVVLKGTPYEEIAKFSAENGIDMIVLGTHGRRGIDRFIFGSTAEQVIRNAPCPVLCVRSPQT